jgi:hypothetical protein
MLREVRARVRQVVQRASLIESCAEQRREIIARQRALEQAEDGVFELIGVHTPAQKDEWMLSIAASMIDSGVCVCVCVCVARGKGLLVCVCVCVSVCVSE